VIHTPLVADMELKRLIKLNHEIDPNNVTEGQTIVVPVGKLSERDRLILDGMGQGRYRTYPIRKGEKLEEVLSKRGITMEEFEKLNPEVNPNKVTGMHLSPPELRFLSQLFMTQSRITLH
jgi:LysM repeat protein